MLPLGAVACRPLFLLTCARLMPSRIPKAAANCTITHNAISEFRQTGISLGWEWSYEPTADSNNVASFNNISTIGMGETSDLGCVYHLGR